MEKIYLAHSMGDYETNYERKMIKKIKEKFGNNYKYINPSEPKVSKKFNEYINFYPFGYYRVKMEMEFFFKIIEKCVILIAIPDEKTGRFTGGVKEEMLYANKIGVDVRKLIFEDDIKLDFITKSDISNLKKWKINRDKFGSYFSELSIIIEVDFENLISDIIE